MRRLIPSGILGRLTLMVILAIIASQLLSLWLFVDGLNREVRQSQVQETVGRAVTVARLLETPDDNGRAAILASARMVILKIGIEKTPVVSATDVDLRIMLSDIRKNLDVVPDRDIRAQLLRSPPLSSGPPPEPSADFLSTSEQNLMPPPFPVTLSLSVELSDGEWLNIVAPLRPSGPFRPPSSLASLFLTFGCIVIALWIGLRWITEPLRSLARAADSLGRGEKLPTLPESGPREVRVLSAAFDQMQERLARLISDRTRMIGALGHDLRSPITALRVRAEMVDDDETRERMIASLDEMHHMVEATLSYARGVWMDAPIEQVDLAELLTDLAKEVSLTGPPVRVVHAAPTVLQLQPVSIRRALRNIFENAQRYGGGATVRLEHMDREVLITVSDTGTGIPEDALETVFEPFVRLEASRSRETGGAGLGLSIARGILRFHGGDVILSNRKEGGLDARIVLPFEAK